MSAHEHKAKFRKAVLEMSGLLLNYDYPKKDRDAFMRFAGDLFVTGTLSESDFRDLLEHFNS